MNNLRAHANTDSYKPLNVYAISHSYKTNERYTRCRSAKLLYLVSHTKKHSMDWDNIIRVITDLAEYPGRTRLFRQCTFEHFVSVKTCRDYTERSGNCICQSCETGYRLCMSQYVFEFISKLYKK